MNSIIATGNRTDKPERGGKHRAYHSQPNAVIQNQNDEGDRGPDDDGRGKLCRLVTARMWTAN